MTLFFVAFLAGVLTVLAPCVLPLLPIVLGGSLSGGTQRRLAPYTIVAALSVSVIVFTLLLKVSTALIAIPDVFWKGFSGGILIVMGMITLFPGAWSSVRAVFSRESSGHASQRLLAHGTQQQSFFGDILVGAALGPVFSACSPTFLVIVGIVLPERFGVGLVYLIAYALGLALVLLLVALLGRRMTERFAVLANPQGLFKKSIGMVFIIVGFAVISGVDKKIETWLLQGGVYGALGTFETQLLNHVEK